MTPGVAHFHDRTPRERLQNARFRKNLLTDCAKEGDEGRDARAAVLAGCKADFLFFVNALVYQSNPNAFGPGSEEVGPFITWDFQDKAAKTILKAIDRRRDVVIEKSREMGASWLCILVFVWLFLFHDRKKLLVISRNLEAVDAPDEPDSLFWKIDFVLSFLPAWVTKGVVRKKLRFKNHRTGSFITGTATTSKAGVGGRATAILVDEFAQTGAGEGGGVSGQDFKIMKRTSDTSACRIFNSTHLGTATAFFEMLYGKMAKSVSYDRILMHWSFHPDKIRGAYRFDRDQNKILALDPDFEYPPDFEFVRETLPAGGPFPGLRSPWYDEQCRRKGDSRDVAMDLDCDPQGAKKQFFDALVIHELVASTSSDPVWQGDVDYDRRTGAFLSLTPTPKGPLKLWVHPTPQGRLPRGIYAAGCDVSGGRSATPTCFSGGRLLADGAVQKVLEYVTATTDPKDFAPIAVALCWLMDNDAGTGAMFVWEIPGPGYVVGDEVTRMGYTHVWYYRDEHSLSKRQNVEKAGWHNDKQSKTHLLRDYRHVLQNRRLHNPSELALKECLDFEYDDYSYAQHQGEKSVTDPSGAGVSHGDRVMADAMMWLGLRDHAQAPFAPPAVEKSAVLDVHTLAGRRALRNYDRRRASSWL